MIKDGSLRHQMVLPQQQDFYDYWRRKCEGGMLPSCADIDPSEIVSQLPMVTLTERVDAPETEVGHRYRFRLAGTGFWRFYGDEIQGRHVDELPIGCRADYWHRVLDMVTEQRRPFHGVTKPNTPIGSHMAQFWVRLPLSSDGVKIDTILGYDHICLLEDAVQTREARQKVYA
ncbi:MAG: PAS domain-containing protein [Pseudomonadota bacterium]